MEKGNVKIFAGTSSGKYARNIGALLGINISECEIKPFSCGETYVRLLETVRGKEVFIVKLFTTGRSNEDLMELVLLCNAAKQSFAKTIHLIIPNFPYSRQDKIHAPRECISAKIVAQILETAGANEIITINLHSEQLQGFFDIPVDNLNIINLFAETIKKKNIKDPVIIAPDLGSAKYSKKIADKIGAKLAIIHKTRPEHNVAEVNHIVGDVKGKTPIIVDDMVDTAGSVCTAKKVLIEMGANPDVYLFATHPVLSGPAIDRLKEANFKEIIFANTVPIDEKHIGSFQILSSEDLVSKVIRSIVERKSVSRLY